MAEEVFEPSISNAFAIAASDTVKVDYGRQIAIKCTVAGNVKLGLYDNTTITIPVNVGLSVLPWIVTQVWVTGTTATATYLNLR